MSEDDYGELMSKEVVMEDASVETDPSWADARTTAQNAAPFSQRFDARAFAIHWGPDSEHHSQRLQRYGPHVGACEMLTTSGQVSVRMLELAPA